MRVRHLGLIVNPIAGIGGRVGLKGSDDVVDEARRRGGTSPAHERAVRFLRALPAGVAVSTAAGAMGADACRAAARPCRVLHTAAHPSTAADTVVTAAALERARVDLITFVGGDGTARDVADTVDVRVPVLGVPAGVKMHSAVFAVTPEAAGHLLASDVALHDAEVLDADEAGIRRGELVVALHGVVRVPSHADVQPGKSPGAGDAAAVAAAFASEADPSTLYIIGPGSTCQEAKRALAGDGTLLGIDVVREGRLVVRDASEADLLRLLDAGAAARIVLCPIGAQGSVLGRGNAPISPAVLRRVGWEAVMLVATSEKLAGLDGIRIDTGDAELDASAPAYLSALVGPGRRRLVRVARPRA